MLENKDYCDYETCVALEELGFPIRRIKVKGKEKYVPILLYEAQKWLREIHNIFVMIDRSFAASNSWYYVICANDDFKHLIEQPSLENYSYEEALAEGIKEAVRILKEK